MDTVVKLLIYVLLCLESAAVLFSTFSLYTSPSGKLVQIEYALAAVASGAPSVGIKGPWVCTCGKNVLRVVLKWHVKLAFLLHYVWWRTHRGARLCFKLNLYAYEIK